MIIRMDVGYKDDRGGLVVCKSWLFDNSLDIDNIEEIKEVATRMVDDWDCIEIEEYELAGHTNLDR